MSAGERCNRYPCDSAYRRGTHEPNADGEVVHRTRAGSESRLVDDELVTIWAASSVAVDDGPWAVHVYVSGERVWVSEPEEASRFAEAVSTANMWALKANADDARREVRALEVDLAEARAEARP